MKYNTVQEALATTKGKALYRTLCESFNQGKAQSPKAVQDAMDRNMTYLGSQSHLERMVWEIMNQKNS